MAEVQTDTNDLEEVKDKSGSKRPENPEMDDNAVEESEITNDDVVDILMDDDDEDFYDEGSFLGTIYEQASILEAAEKLDTEDFKDATKFKNKFNAQLKEKEEQFKGNDKKMGKFAYSWYYAIVGNTFNDMNGKYVSLLPIVLPVIKKYCNDKQKSKIMKDIEATINKLEGMQSKGEQLNAKQKGWLKDIKAVKL